MSARRPLAILGGGPAGMAAAIEAARAGLSVTLIDEAAALGGQIYRPPPGEFRLAPARAILADLLEARPLRLSRPQIIASWTRLAKEFLRGAHLRRTLARLADRVELRLGTSCLGIDRDREILWGTDERTGLLRAERIILATGAYERPVPFPGWTLPGVMGAAGVNTLLKTLSVRPGRSALVAGTGPLFLRFARRLHELGIEVRAVLEAGNPPWSDPAFVGKWGRWDAARHARADLGALQRARIPFLVNHTIYAAYGEGGVERASYGPLDPQGRPIPSAARSVAVDLVCSGFGFVPNTELAVLVGCRHEYVEERGGWIPVREELLRTTVPGIFAVGAGAGVVGAAAAEEEGRIAGITAAEEAGSLSPKETARRRARPLERLGRLRQLQEALDRALPPLPLDLADPSTLLCRCEEVALADVARAIAEGARDLQALKLFTRLGMGPCQGRNCAPATRLLLCRATGRTPAEVGMINPRPPLQPVTLGALAGMTEDAASGDARRNAKAGVTA